MNIPFDKNAIVMTMPASNKSAQKPGLIVDPNIKSGATVRVAKDLEPIVLCWDPNKKTINFTHEDLPSRYGYNVSANLTWTANLVDEAIPHLFLSGMLDETIEFKKEDGVNWFTVTEEHTESIVKFFVENFSRFAMSQAIENYSPDSLRLITLISGEYENIFRSLLEKRSPSFIRAPFSQDGVVFGSEMDRYSDYIVFDRVSVTSLTPDSGISTLVQKRTSLQDKIADEMSTYREITSDSTRLYSTRMKSLSAEIQRRSNRVSLVDSLKSDIISKLRSPELNINILSNDKRIELLFREKDTN